MELHLDRRLAERRVFPAIDIQKSGTRKEELLLPKHELEALWSIRKTMDGSLEFVEQFLRRLKETETNEEFFQLFEKEKSGTA